jgi:hypothetical protein
MGYTVAFFGAAEKGQYRIATLCESLEQLLDTFGHPPADTLGLHFAIQALLYHRRLIFIRVEEEGFSAQDYYQGVRLLSNPKQIGPLNAIGLPNVGDPNIIAACEPLCSVHRSFLILTEADLYDYLMAC